jgi:hypothetical protein
MEATEAKERCCYICYSGLLQRIPLIKIPRVKNVMLMCTQTDVEDNSRQISKEDTHQTEHGGKRTRKELKVE